MKNNPINFLLEQEKFTEEEKKAFINIIKYAKACQQGQSDNLRTYINNKVEEIVNNEISKNKI